MRNDVFQVSQLVDPYQIAPSIDLEENTNFRVTENIFVDVDTKELNVAFSSSRHAQVDEHDDSDEINIEDCDGADEKSIKKKTILTNFQNTKV